MAKDPAFLFYYQDFLTGTRFMSLEAKGAYIDALCYQADKGEITKEHMFIICQSSEKVMSEVCSKFVKNDAGNFYNERLKIEVDKRKSYAESRRNNRLQSNKTKKIKGKKDMKNISKSYDKHMENENEDVNENINTNKDENINEKKVELIYPFDSENFKKQWQVWREFKKEQFKFNYKPIGEQAALKEIGRLSKNNEQTAIAIIHQSINNGWKGFFELKNNKSNGQSDTLRRVIENVFGQDVNY